MEQSSALIRLSKLGRLAGSSRNMVELCITNKYFALTTAASGSLEVAPVRFSDLESQDLSTWESWMICSMMEGLNVSSVDQAMNGTIF